MVLQLSFGPIGWLMISEIFPLRMRGRGLSIAVLVNFGANAIVTFSFSPLKVPNFNHFFFCNQISIIMVQLLSSVIYMLHSLKGCRYCHLLFTCYVHSIVT